MNQTSIHESDSRLPSGEWTGFYLESHHGRRGWMHLYMEFIAGRVRGEGTDYVGPWNLSGIYDLETQTCRWTKQYIGMHQVSYEGLIADNGIQGQWQIAEFHQGPFHVWPRHMHELDQMYMQDDLELGAPTVQLSPSVDFPSSFA